jgi:hypothetical protein
MNNKVQGVGDTQREIMDNESENIKNWDRDLPLSSMLFSRKLERGSTQGGQLSQWDRDDPGMARKLAENTS